MTVVEVAGVCEKLRDVFARKVWLEKSASKTSTSTEESMWSEV
jgi:hypothetical protein